MDDSFASLASSGEHKDDRFNDRGRPKDRNQNPKTQEHINYLSDSPNFDRDNFPPPPPGPAYPGDKTSWLPPGQSHSPHWKNSIDLNGPNDRWNRIPTDVEQRNGHHRKPHGRDYGPQSSQAPFDTQTVVPIYHVPYPLGKENHNNGFVPAMGTELQQEYKPHPQKLYTSSIAIKPPPTFRPIPVNDNDSMPRPAPPTVPPKPFKDTRVFEDVDTHAVEVSKEDHKSFRELVWHLIYARDITNELEKARAIFLWLCSKDLAKLNFDNVRRGSPEEILMQLQSGQTTYAVVYEILCSYAHLHCKTLTGYAKGAEYKPGMRFTGEHGQHSWNAVLVNGAWRLVDCHWAARRLVGKQVTVENIRYELDEYYFMPDPHQLIFTHYPDDGSWQLLERSIALTDFENLVPVKSAFFKYGLQILGHREAVIHTKQEITIRIGCPQFKAHSLAFTFTLAYSSGKEEYHGMKLNRFGMQEMIDNVSFFTIRPPEKASYRLIIYGKDLDQATREGVYGGVCEYELVCDDHPQHSQSFPPCVHTSWGPGDSIAKYNLVPLQKGAIFSTVHGLAEVRFQMPKALRFTAKLKSNDHDEKSLAGYVLNRIVGDVAVFTVNAPARGEYGLEIYANDPDVDGNSLYHAFQYLIICDESVGAVEPLPGLPPGFLGPLPAFSQFGIVAASHVDPYIQTDSGEIQIAISMSQQLLRVTSQLLYASDDRGDDLSDYVLQQCRGNLVVFLVKLARPGLYKFQIYALPFHDASENLPGVYNYLINCTETRAAPVPYPRQYGQWKEGCYLYEPLDGRLHPVNSARDGTDFPSILFRLEVPKANAVAVIIGEQWTQLEQQASGPWEGEISLERHWGRESKVAVCANFTSTKSTNYSTLLEYTI